jgi:isopenicillin N synthase-like dioxygenase
MANELEHQPLVPTIDIAGWAEPAARAQIAAEIDEACRRVGFLQLLGHGVDAGVRAELRASARDFFALPLEEKLRYRPPSTDVNRGYAAQGSESLSYSLDRAAPPDLFEAFNIGVGAPPRPHDDPVVFAPNIWPSRPPELRAAFERYFRAVAGLASRLTEIMAVALGLAPDFFAAKTDASVNVLRANNYVRRAGDPAPAPGQLRMGPHTDYGILTILLADPVPGLQIVGPDGGWHDVVPDPDGFVVNLGDALAVWTNDRWRSTVHRVVPPPASETGEAHRQSFAFFHDGNLDAVMECLPTCRSAANPPRYPPTTLGAHVVAKLRGPRTMRESGAVQTLGDRAGIDRAGVSRA